MFDKILIANRGEIACRVIKTARRMGIATVAVHSDADADALHTRLADQAVAIGPAPAVESYLVIERIVEACRATGAQAVHPGYGFLSENPDFCTALATAGIAFIGPEPMAIAAMGDKIESKKLARATGVDTVPGHLAALADAGEAAKAARQIGYPVMLKASAGGGGKGMRIARTAAEAREGFQSARNEARGSFGDDRVFVEKFIERPRHIEIQVLADGQGGVVHLGERECSIQRRHQKVIEESPSPLLDAAMRRAMGEQAVALARAVDYRSAGTVEFIVDANKNFYFLEMNTRLQVEHPVTEAVTGLDLVELMIRVAAGERLPITQDDVRRDGWSIEARVYAEDPVRGFLPSTGRLVRYRPPPETARVRVDTGVHEGGEISMYYDPMIAKVITHGQDRAGAIAEMRHALDSFEIGGVQHNIGFLAALMNHPRFAEGRLSTDFIAEEFADGFSGRTPDPRTRRRLIAVAAALHRRIEERDRRIAGRTPRRRDLADRVVRLDGVNHPVAVQPMPGGFEIRIDGEPHAVLGDWRIGDRWFDGQVDGDRMVVQVGPTGTGYRLSHGGADMVARVLTPRAAELAVLMPDKPAPDRSKFLLSPMPGLLVSLAVDDGQTVSAGDTLAVVEAMKMENILRAERDGTVAALHAAAGDSLAVDQKILEFE
ncbi:MAG: acetyl/propionyl/methylcrotonyl-CoA carboxylase subunit alpha [Alphaproteobacteria bacterium]